MSARALFSLCHPFPLWASRATGLTDSSREQSDQQANWLLQDFLHPPFHMLTLPPPELSSAFTVYLAQLLLLGKTLSNFPT